MRYFVTIAMFSTFILFSASTAAQDFEQKPPDAQTEIQDKGFTFMGNYPNPVRDYTYFKFRLNTQQQVGIQLFDLLGNEMKSLEKDVYNPGTHTVKMDVSSLKPGVYFYKVHIRGKTITERLNIVN